MNDAVADIARAAAGHVAGEPEPALVQDVEIALRARDDAARPESYVLDPISLGSLIVAIATLAWTVHNDLRNRSSRPAAEVVARTVRVRLDDDGAVDGPERDRIIEIVVDETIRRASRDG